MSELAIGIVGLGRMGDLPPRDVGARRRRAGRRRGRAQRRPGRTSASAGGRSRTSSTTAMLVTRADVDAVCITAPSAQHANIALDAIAAGKHVLVEKPIATTLEDGLRMAAAARGAGVKLMVGHVERFNPAVGKLAALIAEGRIGRVFRAHATRVGPLPAAHPGRRRRDRPRHARPRHHAVRPRPRHHRASTPRAPQLSHPTQEDMIACLLRFGDDGPFGLLDVNWLTPEKRREITVIGEDGMLTRVLPDPGRLVHRVADHADGLGRAGAHPRRRRGRGPALRAAPRRAAAGRARGLRRLRPRRHAEPVTAHDGCRALVAALAVRDSAANSRPVTLLDMPSPAPLAVAA